jgi:CubicO group peptidase (beta-lactamase class C family)
MLKVGQLVLAGGDWNGRRLVPSEWVERATTAGVAIDRGRSYGYHWYMGDLAAGAASQPFHWVGGIGWGGQRLFGFPALDLVVAWAPAKPQDDRSLAYVVCGCGVSVADPGHH